jgi:hypothetical protein
MKDGIKFFTTPIPPDDSFMSLGEFMQGAVKISKSMQFSEAEKSDLEQKQKENQRRRNAAWSELANKVVGSE